MLTSYTLNVTSTSLFYSNCGSDFYSPNKSIALDPFSPICYSNPDNHVAAWYDLSFDLTSQYTPRRTIKRQNIQPWITPSTVHFINKLLFNRKSLNKRHLKTDVQKKKFEVMTKHCEDLQKDDRVNYESKLASSQTACHL